MERKAYISFICLLGFSAYALAMRLLWIWDSFPATLQVRYGSRMPRYFSMTRGHYVAWLAIDFALLPALCAGFAYVAHRAEEFDLVSWAFVVLFYVILWLLWGDMKAAMEAGAAEGAKSLLTRSSVRHPLGPLGFAAAVGLAFWRWKQNWSPDD